MAMTDKTNPNHRPKRAKSFTQASRERLAEDREERLEFMTELTRLDLITQVRTHMAAVGMTQSQLADLCGTSQPMISRFLSTDDDRAPTLETVVKIVDALGKDLRINIVDRPAVSVAVDYKRASSASQAQAWGQEGPSLYAATAAPNEVCQVIDLNAYASRRSWRGLQPAYAVEASTWIEPAGESDVG